MYEWSCVCYRDHFYLNPFEYLIFYFLNADTSKGAAKVYCYHDTHFHIISGVRTCITNNQNCNNFNIQMVFLWLGFSFLIQPVYICFSVKKRQSTCLNNCNRPLSIMNNLATQIVSKFTSKLIEFYLSKLQLKWLFITTKRLLTVTVITIGVTRSQACIILVLKSQFLIWIRDSKPASV